MIEAIAKYQNQSWVVGEQFILDTIMSTMTGEKINSKMSLSFSNMAEAEEVLDRMKSNNQYMTWIIASNKKTRKPEQPYFFHNKNERASMIAVTIMDDNGAGVLEIKRVNPTMVMSKLSIYDIYINEYFKDIEGIGKFRRYKQRLNEIMLDNFDCSSKIELGMIKR